MSDQINLDSLKDKLAKLLAKAEGTTNEHEAEAFMAKVNALLEQHQIGLHEIRAHGARVVDPMGRQRGENNIPSSLAWYKLVSYVVAEYYGAKILTYKYKAGKVPYIIIGPESSRITTEMMLPFIISQVRQVARKYMREVNEKAVAFWGDVATAKACDDYLTEVKAQTHVGLALRSRIWKLIEANKVHRRELESKALVPVDGIQAYLDEHFPKTKTARASTGHTTHAAIKAAEGISLHTQTTTDKRHMIEG